VDLVNAGASGQVIKAAFASLGGYVGKEGFQVGYVGAGAGVGVGVVAVIVVAGRQPDIALRRGERKF